MLRVGNQAPPFSLVDEAGEARDLQGLSGEGPFVLYFYPADFTPVCTKQACMFRDRHAELVEAGVRVFGVSPQGASSHQAFRAKHDLPFTLLVDEDQRAAGAFGLKGLLGMVRRTSYLIGADGQILDLVNAGLRVGRHEDFVDRVLARFGGAS